VRILVLNHTVTNQATGYRVPDNLKKYALYLDARIKAYANLKHDPVRVQSESNRDHLSGASGAADEPRRGGNSSNSQNQNLARSKTMAGRKLRVMSVEKGLLRETKIVQKVIAALLACKVPMMLVLPVGRADHHLIVLPRQSRGRPNHHRPSSPHQGPPRPLPSSERRRRQRPRTLFRNVACGRKHRSEHLQALLRTDQGYR
jgi:hypothetical protein